MDQGSPQAGGIRAPPLPRSSHFVPACTLKMQPYGIWLRPQRNEAAKSAETVQTSGAKPRKERNRETEQRQTQRTRRTQRKAEMDGQGRSPAARASVALRLPWCPSWLRVRPDFRTFAPFALSRRVFRRFQPPARSDVGERRGAASAGAEPCSRGKRREGCRGGPGS